MGWSIVLVGKPMYNATPSDVLRYIVAGGLVYSVGVGMLTFDSLHFNHAIWHCFVMAGSFFHFVAIVLAASHDESSWNKTLSFKSIVASLFSTENKVKTY
jgi:predicted membrane channel-forming protein YqfA (hemolysin III family)